MITSPRSLCGPVESSVVVIVIASWISCACACALSHHSLSFWMKKLLPWYAIHCQCRAMARYVSKFSESVTRLSGYLTILESLQEWGEPVSYQPSKGGPRYTIDTSVLPYTAETLGYSCLSGSPLNATPRNS